MPLSLDEKTIEKIEILAQLELTDQEKEQAKRDMAAMIARIDELKKINTDDVEPLTHLYGQENILREDKITNSDAREQVLRNAPLADGGQFIVPRTM